MFSGQELKARVWRKELKRRLWGSADYWLALHAIKRKVSHYFSKF